MNRTKPQMASRSGRTPSARPGQSATRQAAAWVLLAASATLDRLAHRLATPASEADHSLQGIEFYAQSGAPEGALYVDGQFVGWLPGVQRL